MAGIGSGVPAIRGTTQIQNVDFESFYGTNENGMGLSKMESTESSTLGQHHLELFKLQQQHRELGFDEPCVPSDFSRPVATIFSVTGASIEANSSSPDSVLSDYSLKSFSCSDSFESNVVLKMPSSSAVSPTLSPSSCLSYFADDAMTPSSSSDASPKTTKRKMKHSLSMPQGLSSRSWFALRDRMKSLSSNRLLSFRRSGSSISPNSSVHNPGDKSQPAEGVEETPVRPQLGQQILEESPRGARTTVGSFRLRPEGCCSGRDEGVGSAWTFRPSYGAGERYRSPGEADWAQCKAGEDSSQLIVSEENGFAFAAVFDGFNGTEASDYLIQNLHVAVCEELRGVIPTNRKSFELNNSKSQSLVLAQILENATTPAAGAFFPGTAAASGLEGCAGGSLSEGFVSRVLEGMRRALAKTELSFFSHLQQRMQTNPECVMAGSCVLVAVMWGRHVFTMNLGDSRAVIFQQQQHADEDNFGSSGPMDTTDDTEIRKAPPSSLSAPSLVIPSEVEKDVQESNQPMADVFPCFHLDEESRNFVKCFSAKGVTRPDANALFSPSMLSVDHNTDNMEEVRRVQSEHSDDADVLKRDRVKGKLKVTRAFGAAFLKKREFNDSLLGIFRVKFNSDKGYVSSEPHLQYRCLGPSDRYLVLSSDGLYQYMSTYDVGACLEMKSEVNLSSGGSVNMETESGDSSQGMAQHLVECALKRAAINAGMSLDSLLRIPVGEKRRNYHDDLSVMVIQLTNSTPHCKG